MALSVIYSLIMNIKNKDVLPHNHIETFDFMVNNLIDSYTSLQRIKKSDDTEKEINYQLKILKAKLESFGIVTTDLDL